MRERNAEKKEEGEIDLKLGWYYRNWGEESNLYPGKTRTHTLEAWDLQIAADPLFKKRVIRKSDRREFRDEHSRKRKKY